MNKFIAVLILFLTFAVYLFTAVPCITGDDSGELAGVGTTLGIAHSPGYPLYSIVGKMFVTLVPFGNNAYRINLLSSVFIALASVILFCVILEMTENILISLSAGLMYAFSNVVWAMANTTEVYGLAAFMGCIICWLIYSKPIKNKYILVVYLLFISLTTHYTLGLLGLGLLWWFLSQYKVELRSNWKYHLTNIVLFSILGFSITLFLYVRSKSQPVFDWEDPETLKRFWQVIARLRYGSIALAQGGAPPLSVPVILKKLYFFLQVIKENFTWAGILLFILGMWFCLKEIMNNLMKRDCFVPLGGTRNDIKKSVIARNEVTKQSSLILLLLLIGTGPGFLILANVTLDPSSSALLKRFFFLPFIFVILIISKALKKLPKYVSNFVFVIPVVLFFQNIGSLNHRNEFIFYDYGKNILRTLPQGSIMFSDRADEMEFAIAYLHMSERKRPDISFVDCNAGVSRSIYGDDYYRIWGKPRLAIREKIETAIIQGTRRPVYYATFEPQMIDIPRFQEGLIYKVDNSEAEKKNIYPYIYSLRIPDYNQMDKRSLNLLFSYFHLMGKYCLTVKDMPYADLYFKGLVSYDKSRRWAQTVGFLYHKNGLLNMAEAYYLKSRPNTEVYTNLGAIYELKNDLNKAMDFYQKALQLDYESVQTHFNLAVLYWHMSNWNKVVEELKIVLELNPEHADAKKYLKLAENRLAGK
ncbi:MAG: DUF2723 domain-containing protein [Endomicrobiales bacterium]|nr:DUF2723 domain-containing protein [Endomicrobiales bacterium]